MSEEQKKIMFYSRGFAAYSIFALAGADENNASKSITDGFDDNGIDAIYFDIGSKLLWIVQSKWIQAGKGSPELGEIKKFRDGIRDLVELNFTKFNAKVREPARQKEIQDALRDHEVKIRIVIAFTGDKISSHAKTDFDELVNELNDDDPAGPAQYYQFNLTEAHKTLSSTKSGQPINLDINLTHWGQITDPLQAIYGVANAVDISAWWFKYHRRLFSDNIRSFIGASDVNASIQDTLKKNPEYFWYFNNGITLVCKKILKAPLGGSDKSVGIFHCENVSVVNGAQTVGNIGEVAKDFPVDNAKVLVRIISLEGSDEKFGQNVTRAANTQNRIEKRDFVTQDETQSRLALEMSLLEKRIAYHYIRTDEVIPQDDNNCTLDEATIALACAYPDIDITILAKRELGKLWDNIQDKTTPYHKIFNESTSGVQLWRSVQIMRKVSSYLKSFESGSMGRKRSLYVHGNRFILHLVFCKLGSWVGYSDNTFNEKLNTIEQLVDDMLAKTWEITETKYPDSLIHQVFRNYTKSRDIKNEIK
jgi:hypothetical protein